MVNEMQFVKSFRRIKAIGKTNKKGIQLDALKITGMS